jgi:peptidoglycan/xylan/chitin deacetylase (PgdA/CDA1 family)
VLAVLSTLRQRVEPQWSIAIVTCAAALLLLALSSMLAELIEVSAPRTRSSRWEDASTPAIAGRLLPDELGWRVGLTGPPGETVLVKVEGLEPRSVVLNSRGQGSVTGVELPAGVLSVQLVLITDPPVVVYPEVTPTPSVTPSPSPTTTPTVTPGPKAEISDQEVRDPVASVDRPLQTPRILTAQEQATVRSAPPVLHLVVDSGSRIAITFDGATSANGTAELLDVLSDLDLHVTLFVTGEFIDNYPGLVRRALLAGHEIGNHTYSHSNLTSYAENRRHRLLAHVTREWLHDELRRTEEAFLRATGRRMAPVWRAPFGEENGLLRGWGMELGYLHVRWSSLRGASLDSLDWVDDEHSSLYRDSDRMIERLLRFPKLEGGIVLMHMASDRPEPPWIALPQFVDRLTARGLEPVTVNALLMNSKTWRPWLERAARRHREVFPPQR